MIPVIGWLFLFQVIAAFGLAIVVLASGSRLAAAAGAGFAAATMGGYLLTVWIGLFGFKEVRTTAGIVAGVIEVAAYHRDDGNGQSTWFGWVHGRSLFHVVKCYQRWAGPAISAGSQM